MNYSRINKSIAALLIVLGLSFNAQAQDADIVDLAVATDDLSTLVTAVKAAGLVETLKGDGPFTVFAPTNAAFEALPDGVLDILLKPENKDQLVAVLTYHVLPTRVMSKDLEDGMSAETVEGSKVNVGINYGTVKINNATVAMADIMADNGVVHVIDTVILPPSIQKALNAGNKMKSEYRK